MQAEVRALAAPEFWFATAFVAALTLGALYAFVRAFHRARLIEDIPTSKIRSAAQGYVELQGFGKLLDGPPIIAPLTGRTCTWFDFSVEKREVVQTKNGSQTRWRKIRSGTSDALFILEDGTGRCLVDPEGATVIPDEADTWYGHTPWPSADLGGHDRLFATGDYRYRERRLMPEESLYALGEFRTVGTDYQPPLAEDVAAILRAWKTDPATMRSFDTNADGQIDPVEWEAARRAAETQALRERAARAVIDVAHVIARSNDRRRPFILSPHHPDHLATRYRWQAAGGALAFLASLFLTAYLLIARFTA